MTEEKIQDKPVMLASGIEQHAVPRAKGKGNYGSNRMAVLLESIESALFICPASDKLIQHRLQQAWVLVKTRVVVDQAAIKRQHARLFE